MSRRIPTMPERLLMKFRVGLRGFLVLCIVLGSAIGLSVRWWLALPVYYEQNKTVDGFRVQTLWERRRDRHKLLYLLSCPDGDRHSAVKLKPNGVFLFTNQSEGRPERYWVYVNSGGSGNVRPVVDAPPLTPGEFAEIENTSLWKEHLRPALVYESQQFDRWFAETRGTPIPSRFTSLETFREWIAEVRSEKKGQQP